MGAGNFILPRVGKLERALRYHWDGGKQAQFGPQLAASGPETPSKTIGFRNVKISTLILP